MLCQLYAFLLCGILVSALLVPLLIISFYIQFGSIIGSKPKSKSKREKTKEERTFRKRAKYFVAAQLVSVLLFLTFMNRSDDEVELDDDDGYGYDD